MDVGIDAAVRFSKVLQKPSSQRFTKVNGYPGTAINFSIYEGENTEYKVKSGEEIKLHRWIKDLGKSDIEPSKNPTEIFKGRLAFPTFWIETDKGIVPVGRKDRSALEIFSALGGINDFGGDFNWNFLDASADLGKLLREFPIYHFSNNDLPKYAADLKNQSLRRVKNSEKNRFEKYGEVLWKIDDDYHFKPSFLEHTL